MLMVQGTGFFSGFGGLFLVAVSCESSHHWDFRASTLGFGRLLPWFCNLPFQVLFSMVEVLRCLR